MRHINCVLNSLLGGSCVPEPGSVSLPTQASSLPELYEPFCRTTD